MSTGVDPTAGVSGGPAAAVARVGGVCLAESADLTGCVVATGAEPPAVVAGSAAWVGVDGRIGAADLPGVAGRTGGVESAGFAVAWPGVEERRPADARSPACAPVAGVARVELAAGAARLWPPSVGPAGARVGLAADSGLVGWPGDCARAPDSGAARR
jgi:hypothetical protein